MKYILTIAVIAIISLTSNSIFSQPNSIIDSVKSIGMTYYGMEENKLSFFETNLELSVRYLIEELHPIYAITQITGDKYDEYQKEEHILWCIRALRHLTGMDFTAKTKYRFRKTDSYRKGLLTHNGKTNELPFFRNWMSRGTDFIAPVDVQLKIINQWKKWYNENQGHIRLNKLEDFNDWYF